MESVLPVASDFSMQSENPASLSEFDALSAVVGPVFDELSKRLSRYGSGVNASGSFQIRDSYSEKSDALYQAFLTEDIETLRRLFDDFLKNPLDYVRKCPQPSYAIEIDTLPGFNFFECSCPLFDRSKLDTRRLIEKLIVKGIEHTYPDPLSPLKLQSIGSGGLFQDLTILARLMKKGYSNITVHFIDPYTREEQVILLQKLLRAVFDVEFQFRLGGKPADSCSDVVSFIDFSDMWGTDSNTNIENYRLLLEARDSAEKNATIYVLSKGECFFLRSGYVQVGTGFREIYDRVFSSREFPKGVASRTLKLRVVKGALQKNFPVDLIVQCMQCLAREKEKIVSVILFAAPIPSLPDLESYYRVTRRAIAALAGVPEDRISLGEYHRSTNRSLHVQRSHAAIFIGHERGKTEYFLGEGRR